MAWFDLVFFSGCAVTIAAGGFIYVRRLAYPTEKPKKVKKSPTRKPENDSDFWCDRTVHGGEELPPLPASPIPDRRTVERRVDDFVIRLIEAGITKMVFDLGSLIRPSFESLYGPNFKYIQNFPRTRWNQASSLNQCLSNQNVFRRQPSKKDFIEPELLLELLYQLLFRLDASGRVAFRVGFIAQTHRVVVNHYFIQLFGEKDHPVTDRMVYTPAMITDSLEPTLVHQIGLSDDTSMSVSVPLFHYFEQRTRHSGQTLYIGTDPTVLTELRRQKIPTLDLSGGFDAEFT